MLRRSLGCCLTLLVFYPSMPQKGFASLAYPKVSVTLQAEPLQTPLEAQSNIRTVRYHKVRTRETLGSILRRWSVSRSTIDAMAASCQELIQARFLKPGITIKGTFLPEDGQMVSLEVPLEEERMLVLEGSAKGAFIARIEQTPLERRILSHRLGIQTGLAQAATEADLPPGLALELSDVYSSVLDLDSALAPGDSVRFLAEGFFHRGNLVKTGPVLAAEVLSGSRTFRAFRFEGQYYDETGQSLRGSMLRSPMLQCRVLSGFRVRRVGASGRVRFHKGVDLSGAHGAPIRSIGNGTVVFAGRSGAYGRMIKIQHNAVYTTLYAHLSRFAPKMEVGTSVRQGDILGYVGQSGRATGPHLHYEVYKYGKPVNPMTIELPSADPVLSERWPEFVEQVLLLEAQLRAGSPSELPFLQGPLESSLHPGSEPVSSVPSRSSGISRF